MQEKFKDKNPKETIEYVKKIIKDLGLELIVTEKDSNVGVYSVNIEGYYKGTVVNITNGKGTSPDYALASGLAEFLERIQNRVCVSDTLFEYVGDFKCYPDETYIKVEDLYNNYSNILDYMNLIDTSKNDKNEILCIPFNNLITEQKVYFPVYKIDNSNGFCAGNSKEEAIVQGISELVERYCQSTVLEKQLNPPIIPNEILKQYPDLYKIICNIRKESRYKLLIKDCTLIEGFPVVASILIDKEEHRYAVNFGSFPSFRIALERCLTELLQNSDLNTVRKQYIGIGKNFSEKYFSTLNILDALKDGYTYYPFKFFREEDFDFEINGIVDREDKNNTELLNIILNIFKNENIDIYARNNSFLGFNSWQLKSPQLMVLSEKAHFADYAEVVLIIVRMLINKDLSQMTQLDIAKLGECIKKITNAPIEVSGRLDKVLRKIPLLEDLKLFTVFGTIALKAKLYDEAYFWYDSYMKSGIDISTFEQKVLVGLYDYLGLLLDNHNLSEINEIQKNFFTLEIEQTVTKIMKDELDIFEVLFKTDENTYNRFFDKEKLFNTFWFYENLKTRMKESEIFNK